MKNLAILGSTGSIGRNTLNVVAQFPDRFSVQTLTAKDNVALLADQIKKFSPELAVVFSEERADALKKELSGTTNVEILYGQEGYEKAATHASVDIVVTAMVGAAGLLPTLSAIEAGKDIALSNKETLVMAGEMVMKRAKEKGVNIFPVDSEHSAIFQSLLGHRKEDLNRIHLTASGGPFRKRPKSEFSSIQPEDALKHPTWDMGARITIDSATLMNKGLEVIEAMHLFGVSQDQISVVIHPQSIVHSMVSYRDGSIIAQLGVPDMRGAIAYAISYPERLPLSQPIPDFGRIGSLIFEDPEFDKFPCLGLAFEACKNGGAFPAVLNAADEIAVAAFLDKKISFNQIPEIIRKTLDAHRDHGSEDMTLSDILDADSWARSEAEEITRTL